MKTNCTHTSKASAVAFLLLGGAVTASFIAGKPAHAQFIGNDSQSRVSAAVTSVLSNGTTNSFASEIVFPQNSITPTGQLTLKINYSTVGHDPSQVTIIKGNMYAGSVNYTDNSIEAAIARAIDAALNDYRFGDIIGIIKSWQSGGSSALD
ncbi:TEK-like protein [Sphaerospermopsis aphanizomenoides BCCUSP55]|uniref:TEK-like protein n=1 Tax=Sphaerospermopsis aphanizomenoides TaxID=459663 RepID=UPI0019063B31|nr:TEK-like protein [Sphaerospermopsis aphanizomenoides]MBK1988947.1 TEK-like protein [Sphaerospermopsis aphanizomenoides BCCUSP55]